MVGQKKILIRWLAAGLIVGGYLGNVVHKTPEPIVKTKIEVVHVPSLPKIYTHKEVETKYVQQDLPESCSKMTPNMEKLVSLANKYEMQARSFVNDNSTDKIHMANKQDALQSTLNDILYANDAVKTAKEICNNDIKQASD